MKFVFTDKRSTCPTRSTPAEKKVGKLDRYFKADAEGRHRLQRGEGPEQRGSSPCARQHDHPRVWRYLRYVCYHRRGGLSVERQLRKNKARLEAAAAPGCIRPNRGCRRGFLLAPEEEERNSDCPHQAIPIKHMTVEEAVLQMNLVITPLPSRTRMTTGFCRGLQAQ